MSKKLEEFAECCCVCLVDPGSEQKIKLSPDLEYEISKLFRHQIHSHDSSPPLICFTCLTDLKTCISFRKKLEATQTFLSQLIEGFSKIEEPTRDPISVDIDEMKIEPDWLMDEENEMTASDVDDFAIEPIDGRYPCYQCEDFFDTEQEVLDHAQEFHRKFPTITRHPQPPTQLPIDANPDDYEFRSFQCNQCDRSYFSKGQLRFHQRDKHGGDEKLPCTFEGCKKVFLNKFRLASHVRYIHHKPISCLVKSCKKKFASRVLMLDHQEIHNRLEFPCEVEGCLRSFRDEKKLGRHNELVHVGRFSCDLCVGGENFCRNKNSLELHMETVHGVRKWEEDGQV